MKNLVMGSASGYDWNTLEPFVASFVRNCPSAELVLFVNDISDFTRNRLISCVGGGVILAPFKVLNHPVTDRWKSFLDYLEAHGDEYEQVLCTDTRDVIFQGDVFTPFKNYSKYLGYTTEDDDIRGSKAGNNLNYRWLTQYFNKQEADKLADKQIICCGTIIATVDEMKIFLRAMIKHIPCPKHGADQVTQQYFTYNGLLPIDNLIEIDTHSGEIFTSYLFHETHPVEIRDNKILRGDGGVPAVVHQYDRQKSLIQLVDNVYRDKKFKGDERFTDPRSILEQIKQLLHIGKPDEAARFFMNNHGADFGGEIDRLLKLWEMLLSRPLTPAVGYLELSMQNAPASVKNFPQKNLDKICSLLVFAIKNRRAVNPQLVQFIAGGLLNLAGQFIDARAASPCFFCLDTIKALELPPNKDFYLLQAKAFRTFGRKDEALAAYKQALDFN